MRIISKYKDYYDCVQRHGQDKSIVYVRDTKEIDFTCFDKLIDSPSLRLIVNTWRSLPFHLNSFNYGIDSALIGFCGEWHVYIKIRNNHYSSCRSSVVYSYSDLLEFAESEKNEKLIHEISSDKPYDWSGDLTYKTMFDVVKNIKNDLFVELKCPVISVCRIPNTGKNIVEFNGSLRRFEFAKVKDPFQAYQCLSMYIGGVLGTREKEMVKIDDDIMRDKKGFDKWSFRKQSSK
jgi:hypothetical protein